MKSVLVTGGTIRLGAAISARLRADGWRVITTSHRADAGADIVCDLSQPDGADRMFASVRNLLNGTCPDALVNNAALFTGNADVQMAVNLESPRRLTSLMSARPTGRGVVVNILDAHERPGTYGLTKRALSAFTREAALRYMRTLRVNGVAPGPVLAPTDVHEAAGETPLGRPTSADVAAAVSFLLTASATTGCILSVDGGQSLATGQFCEARAKLTGCESCTKPLDTKSQIGV